jgi:hypothetical protein
MFWDLRFSCMTAAANLGQLAACTHPWSPCLAGACGANPIRKWRLLFKPTSYKQDPAGIRRQQRLLHWLPAGRLHCVAAAFALTPANHKPHLQCTSTKLLMMHDTRMVPAPQCKGALFSRQSYTLPKHPRACVRWPARCCASTTLAAAPVPALLMSHTTVVSLEDVYHQHVTRHMSAMSHIKYLLQPLPVATY